MKNKLLLLISIFLFCFSQKITAQKTILLLDGTIIKAQDVKLLDSLNIYTYLNSKNKLKEIDRDFIYSITDATGKESVVYQPDTTNNEIGVKEMRLFIKGEQYVHDNYKPYPAALSGFAVGLGSSVSFPLMKINAFYSTFVPLAYVGGQIFVKHNVKIMGLSEDIPYREYYIQGFRDKAVKKRFVYTIIGAFVGTSIGLTINGYRMTH